MFIEGAKYVIFLEKIKVSSSLPDGFVLSAMPIFYYVEQIRLYVFDVCLLFCTFAAE